MALVIAYRTFEAEKNQISTEKKFGSLLYRLQNRIPGLVITLTGFR